VIRRHLVLVGLPGAGKTTVGRHLATLLDADFVDVDRFLVSRTGRTIDEIFATEGEPRFRELERDAMARLLKGQAAVIAPGGGWAAQPGEMERARARALLVYLRVSPATAARRVERSRQRRPLLATGDATAKVAALLEAREPFYRLADVTVDVEPDRGPLATATDIAAIARRLAGW